MSSVVSLDGAIKSIVRRSDIRWHTRGGCQYELVVVMPIEHGEVLWIYGCINFIFVGWTEMCSQHGDTAKFEYQMELDFYFLDQIIWSKISWMGQRCDKSNRYAMPLERSIEVCISLNIRLDSLFLIQCWRSRLKQSSTSGGSLKRACQS